MNGPRRLVSGFAIATIVAACDASPPPVSIDWVPGDGYRARPLSYAGEDGGRFTAVEPDRTGIQARTTISLDRRLENRTMVHGTGVALGDVDGDGWVDVYVSLLDQPNALYRNLGGWRFEDVSQGSGAELADRLSRGAVFADVDGDEDLDLLVAVHGDPNALLINDGTGRFEERDAGFAGRYGSSTIALADIEGDGDLDVYVANYKTAQGDDLFSPEERNLRGYVEQVGDELIVSAPYDEHYRLELVGQRSLRYELADPDEFYLNDGTGRFEAVDLTGGMFAGPDGVPITAAPRDWGLVARFFDADDDLDADLYVANDFGSADGFWLNEGGRFVAASGLALRTTSASSMGVDFSDVDGDGDTDFITTEMLALDEARRREQPTGVDVARTPPGGIGLRAPAARNALQLNRGDGTYAEVARAAGVDASEWTWGAMFLDADLDGWQDLLVTNGHAWDPRDGDTQEDLRTGRIQVDWRRELGVFPPLALRNLAFRNRGDGTFEEAGAWQYGTDPDVSHGIASADLDRDGDLDLVITRLDEPPLVLRNDAGGPRVAVRVGGQSVGARVTLQGGAVPLQTRQVTAGGMYLSGSDPLLVFAMGSASEATLTITWPNGSTWSGRVEADHAYEVAGPGGDAPAEVAPVDAAEPLFVSTAASGGHAESVFDELARQPLIPLELSRGGPGVSWIDVDGDGDEDLIVGAGAGGQAQFWRNDGGRLAAPQSVGAPAPGDQTTILGVLGAGGPQLLAGVSSWEARSPDERLAIPPLMALGGAQPGVVASESATGPLAAADVDGDGDLDLFVGGRASAGDYPRPTGSRLLLNGPNGWIVDSVAESTMRTLGLVSGAVFSDIDDDGDPDLLLALEWGPVTLLINDQGRFRNATEAWGLSDLAGRWNGVATGDFDGNGLVDVVATAWGSNGPARASVDRPIGVVAADFDGNGLVDIVEFGTDADGRERPLRDYPTLATHVAPIRQSAPTFEVFARAAVAELVDTTRSDAFRATATTLEHTVFLNRGDRFEATSLPASTQLAPAFGVVVADVDRDGVDDVVMSQNYLATPRGIERYDAGQGVVLLGSGDGQFRVLTADRSGLRAMGDGRGVAASDFNGDGRVDLAIGQNGGPTLILSGSGGEPGLRVRVQGSSLNPGSVGTRLRAVYENGHGPVREVQLGSGYWSVNGPVHVLGRVADLRAVEVRWPDGSTETFSVQNDQGEIVVIQGSGS